MANPQVPGPAIGVTNLTAWIDDYGGVTGYATAGGAEADMATGVVALETAVGTYAGGADVATDLAAVVVAEAALETEVGDYTGGGGAEADIATGVVALEGYVGTDDSEGDLFTRVAAIETDLESAADEVIVPLGSLRWNTGAAIAAFVDNTTDGFELSGSECLGIRWNNDTAPRITVAGELHVPSDWDDTAATQMIFEGFRVGAADAAMVLTVTVFAQEVGDAYTADADAGGSTTAFDGATTVITAETLDFAADVLPAGAKVTFTAVADAALDGDDFVLTGVKLVGTRKMRTA